MHCQCSHSQTQRLAGAAPGRQAGNVTTALGNSWSVTIGLVMEARDPPFGAVLRPQGDSNVQYRLGCYGRIDLSSRIVVNLSFHRECNASRWP